MADPRNLPPDVADALAKGNVIEAIKRMRQHTNLGLAEAKGLIESLQKQGGKVEVKTSARTVLRPTPHAGIERRPGLSPGEVPRGAGGPVVAAIVLVVILALGAAAYFKLF
jgi:hypothetical protein